MGDVTPDRYVLDVIQKIKANDLEESLLVLPFSKVMSLLAYIEMWAKKVSIKNNMACFDYERLTHDELD
jgi:U3 small nucleolar RNA-associated protein 12